MIILMYSQELLLSAGRQLNYATDFYLSTFVESEPSPPVDRQELHPLVLPTLLETLLSHFSHHLSQAIAHMVKYIYIQIIKDWRNPTTYVHTHIAAE